MTKRIDKLRNENMNNTFKTFCWRVTSIHTIAYFFAVIAAIITLNYEQELVEGFVGFYMRPIDSPIVPLGAALQLVNGFFMSLILYPFRNEIIGDLKHGWRNLALLIFGLTMFAPQIPGPGNLEGLIYTKIPILVHIISFPEAIVYTLLFSLGLVTWFKMNKKWMQTTAIVLIVLVLLMSGLGYLDVIGVLPEH